jgi:hypothetical protein
VESTNAARGGLSKNQVLSICYDDGHYLLEEVTALHAAESAKELLIFATKTSTSLEREQGVRTNQDYSANRLWKTS